MIANGSWPDEQSHGIGRHFRRGLRNEDLQVFGLPPGFAALWRNISTLKVNFANDQIAGPLSSPIQFLLMGMMKNEAINAPKGAFLRVRIVNKNEELILSSIPLAEI